MKIAILGAGSWGLTLSQFFHQQGCQVKVWEFDSQQAQNLRKTRKFTFLPDFRVPGAIFISSSLPEVIEEARIIVLVVPSKFIRTTLRELAKLKLNRNTVVLSAVKGLEEKTLLLMSEVIGQEIPCLKGNIVVLSGPTIARELSQGKPAAAVLASTNPSRAELVQKVLKGSLLRLYTSRDVRGVQLGGALKNIIAIACGVSDGLGLGTNAKSALMTRGLVEICRLGVARGGEKGTFSGLSGMGDLITTCFSPHSRNRTFGEKIGQGDSPSRALKQIGMVVEGYNTVGPALSLARKLKIEMPITDQVGQILVAGKKPESALSSLMARDLKKE